YEDDHAGLPSPQRSDPGCGSRPRRPRRRTRSSAIRSTRLFVRGPLWSPVLVFAARLIPDDGFGLSAMHRCTAFRPVLWSEGSVAGPPDPGTQQVFAAPPPRGVRRPSDDYDAGDPRIPKFSDRHRRGRDPDEMRALYTAGRKNQRLEGTFRQ